MKDNFGNEFEGKTERKDGKIIMTQTYTLEPGKTTLRGEHPKFRKDQECAHPDRLCCNYGICFERCEYMKFISVGNWTCVFKKEKL